MTDKDKIRAEVERLMNELIQEKEKGFGSDIDDACIIELQNVLTFIDSLQEDSIEYNPFDDFRHTDSEEPVREVFENALAKEWKGYNDRGAATVDALEDNMQELAFSKGFYIGWHYRKEDPVSSDFISLVDKEARELWKEINLGNGFSIVDSFNQFYGICMQMAESAVEWQKNKEEPISEDLLDEIHNRWEDDPHTKWPKCPYKDFKNIACHFANWQKEQIKKTAIEAYVDQVEYPGSTWIQLSENPKDLKDGDDIKIYIIKEK